MKQQYRCFPNVELLEPRYCLSTVAFVAHEVDVSHRPVADIEAADIDGDGDRDMLVASADGINWYENTNGTGNFGPQNLITKQAHAARSLHAADLDRDGDLDIIVAHTEHQPSLAWYENIDGEGTFAIRPISNVAGYSVSAADLDGDADLDILLVSSHWFAGNEITWYENTDGLGTFGTGTHIDQGFDWNGDRDFDSSDLVAAFQAGHYVSDAQPLASEVAAAIDAMFADEEAK